MELTAEHEELRRSALKFVENEINPFANEWEENEIFPAGELFKKLGNQGFLGITKPEKYGGAGLDYTYGAVLNEAIAHSTCGGIPMAIGVQTDMATPALARFGSEKLCNEFLRPSISGDYVACLGVSEPALGSETPKQAT
jgi:citronellyl-CoA dehydrogenase